MSRYASSTFPSPSSSATRSSASISMFLIAVAILSSPVTKWVAGYTVITSSSRRTSPVRGSASIILSTSSPKKLTR